VNARTCATAALTAVAALLLASCGSPRDDAQRSSLSALTISDPESVAPHTPPSKDDFPDPDPTCPPFRSAPPGHLRAPGKMKPNTLMHEIQERGELRVGVDQNTLGLGYFNPITSHMEGFEIDLVRQIARAILGEHPKIRYTAISTAQRESVVTNGDVDLVASSFSINCDRRSTMLFSSVYYQAQMRLLVPKRPPVADLGDLRGRAVCVTRKSTTISRLSRLSKTTGIRLYVVPLRSDCLVALQEGTVDAISSDDAILYGLVRQDPQTEIVGPGLQCESWGLAMSKEHPELVPFVNAVLQRLRRSGFTKRRREHWLQGLTPPEQAAPCRR